MKPWEIDEVRRAVKGKWMVRGGGGGGGGKPFSGRIATDSRKAAEGDLFFAIAGQRFDAHDFLKDVIEKGVAGVIVHKEPAAEIVSLATAKEVAVLLVDNTIAALNRLAAAYRQQMAGGRTKVIAVGGSNGKTTTKRIIHALLSEKFHGHASPKSFNNNIGMPLTLLEVEAGGGGHDYVVLEIGTNAPGEIAALGDVCRPDIAVITSIGLEHLELLGDLAGVAREEGAIAGFMAEGGTMVLPADGVGAAELLSVVKRCAAQKILVGRAAGNDHASMTPEKKSARRNVRADLVLADVVATMDGTSFSINGRGGWHVALLGEHNAANALMAIAVARRMGLSDDQIAAGLGKVKAAEMRFERVPAESSGPFSIINDAYNANPSSMQASLRTFAAITAGPAGAVAAPGPTTGGRKVAILGDMLELGPASQMMHQEIGALVCACGFDVFIAVGRQMAFAAQVAAAGGVQVARFADTAAARRGARELLRQGDRILLKGSRGMALETLLDALQEVPLAAAAQR